MIPISSVDLPHIVEAIKILHRNIEFPPTENWRPPVWLVNQVKKTSLGEEGVPKENPGHAAVIQYAAIEVLNLLMPTYGWYHTRNNCPEITESNLDRRHKKILLDLRDLLSRSGFGQVVAENRDEQIEVLDFLENAIKDLGGSCEPRRNEEDADSIQFLTDGKYQVPGHDPITVTNPDDNVLQSFLNGLPLELSELTDLSRQARPDLILKNLTIAYGGILKPYIRLPGGKNRGGYFVRVCRRT
jgi:hypothetical protein